VLSAKNLPYFDVFFTLQSMVRLFLPGESREAYYVLRRVLKAYTESVAIFDDGKQYCRKKDDTGG
jgi:hypothetical protein